MNNSIYYYSFICPFKLYQVFLYNSNNLKSVICLHTFKWLYIYDLHVNSLLVILYLNELEIIYLDTIKNCYCLYATQMNGFNYCNQTLIILLNINHLFAHSEEVTSIAI